MQQTRNRRSTITVEFAGRRITLGELAEVTGLAYDQLYGRWARGLRGDQLTAPVQRRRTLVTFHGERMTCSALAKRVGLPLSTLYARLKRGVPVEQAVLPSNSSPSES